MKKIIIIIIVLAGFFMACGSPEKESGKKSEKKAKTEKKEKKKLDVKTYCKVVNEERAILMEKYWDKFKGKSYEEAKDIYADYQKEVDAVYKKYGIENKLDISNYFRGNFREIQAFQKNNPEYKEYDEYNDAKRKLIEFASARIN